MKIFQRMTLLSLLLFAILQLSIWNVANAAMTFSIVPKNNAVEIYWSLPTDSEISGVNIYRSTTNGIFDTKVNQELVTANSYFDYNLSNGTTYYYLLRTVSKDGVESTLFDSSTSTATPSADLGEPRTISESRDSSVKGESDEVKVESWWSKPILGINRTFWFVGIIFFGAFCCLLLLLKKPKVKQPTD